MASDIEKLVGASVCVAVAAVQSPLDGGRKLQPGQIAKCESVIDCAVTSGRKYAILRWEQIDVGMCRVGVDVRDVRRIEI